MKDKDNSELKVLQNLYRSLNTDMKDIITIITGDNLYDSNNINDKTIILNKEIRTGVIEEIKSMKTLNKTLIFLVHILSIIIVILLYLLMK